MEKMAAAAGRTFNNHQHDGIGALRSASEAVKRAVDVKVVVHELEDPGTPARSAPTWIRLKLKMEFSGYHQLLQRCRQHVILGRANTVDFAKLAAAQLVPFRWSEKRTTYESFKKGGFWLVRNRDDLGQTVEDLMCKKRVLRSPIPADRMGFHAKATSEMWQGDQALRAHSGFLEGASGDGGVSVEASENGKQSSSALRNWSRTGARSSAT